MRWKSVLCTTLAAACLAASAEAQTLITFETRAEAGSINGVAVDANVTGGVLSRGAGVTLNAGGTYNSASCTRVPTSLPPSPTTTTTPSRSTSRPPRWQRSIRLSSDTIAPNTGPGQSAPPSSVTGFTASATPIFTDSAVDVNGENNSITVTGHTGLGSVEFRLYCWVLRVAGTFDIEVISAANPGVGIIVNGTSTGGTGSTGAVRRTHGARRPPWPPARARSRA